MKRVGTTQNEEDMKKMWAVLRKKKVGWVTDAHKY